ncbi:hypothetical protein ACGFMK_03565 [Amycolatopsis sp. NPDC049252]|uniref:hypothetical protein n=1 Tax=Amycolatopsis sp. NPDC049252 TaxID=3363933 RepID=UPI00371DE0D1
MGPILPGGQREHRQNERMYCLEAVIAREAVLRRVAGSVDAARVVPLGQGLSLLPMTDEFFDAVTVAGAGELDGFWKAPAGFGDTLAISSRHGPFAYVEADYFGGEGMQCAQVWSGGAVTLGPVRTGLGERPPASGSPISQALRAIGVLRGAHFDEFDAVGLGRHRETVGWL